MSAESRSKERPGIVTLGTAGHIDHGKTALVKALSGIDTDRLPEEKRRGISIDLGFAHFTTPAGREVGLVDVPGHERFIRNMVAGVSGIRAFLLVVAASEGVMPQSREHKEVLELLGIERGIVVLTKCDLATEEQRATTRAAVASWLAGSPLAAAEVIDTSVGDAASIASLADAIDRLLAGLTPPPSAGLFRLPVDRAFSLKGHGTIVTGTVASGTLRAGESIELLPSGIRSRVRSLQAFDRPVDAIFAGQRAAMNLSDVALDRVSRGDLAALPGTFHSSSLLDARLRLLSGLPTPLLPLKSGIRVRFFAGTRDVGGRLHFLEGRQLDGGESALVQLRLEAPVAQARGDRYLLRLDSPQLTIGGGEILDPRPAKHRKAAPAAAHLVQVEHASTGELVAAMLRAGRALFTTSRALGSLLTLPEDEVVKLVEEQVQAGSIQRQGEFLFDSQRLATEGQQLLHLLDAFHERNPTADGLDRLTLARGGFAAMPIESFDLMVSMMAERGEITVTNALICRAGWRPRASSRLEAPALEVEGRLEGAPELFLNLNELERQLKLMRHEFQELVKFLVSSGKAVKVGPEMLISKANHGRLLQSAMAAFGTGGKAGMTEFKAALGLSRKYLIPFLEHLDATGVTARSGNDRVLRGTKP